MTGIGDVRPGAGGACAVGGHIGDDRNGAPENGLNEVAHRFVQTAGCVHANDERSGAFIFGVVQSTNHQIDACRPDGTFQMFIRDPSNNLVEISAPPGSDVDESIFAEDDLCQRDTGAYVSGREDARGLQSDDASLYHDKS